MSQPYIMADPDPRPSPAPRTRLSPVVVVTAPAVLALVVFAGTLANGIVFDDEWTLGRLDKVGKASVTQLLQSGRSLTYLTHRLDRAVWGDATWAPHLTNVLLHAAATALVGLLALRLSRSRRVGVLCGALFAVHPVHVEVVASLSYRKDVLALAFGVGAVLLWRGARTWPRTVGALACLLAAVYSKEVAAVGIVPMLLAVDLLERRPGAPLRPILLRFSPFLLLGIGAAVWFATNVTLDETFDAIRHESNGQITTWAQVLATTFAAVPDVGRLLVWPATLSADYPIEAQASLTDGRAVAGLAALLGWIAATALLVRRAPVAAFAMGWVLVTWLPASNVVPLTHFFVAERYLYVPSLGICLAAALVIDHGLGDKATGKGPSPRTMALVVTVLLVAAGSARSYLRVRDWRGGYSLWMSALQDGFETRRIHGNVGREMFLQGRQAASILHYQRAYEVHPCTEEALYLAQALSEIGRPEEAASHCRTILELEPGNRPARQLLRRLEGREGGDGTRR